MGRAGGATGTGATPSVDMQGWANIAAQGTHPHKWWEVPPTCHVGSVAAATGKHA